LKPRNTPWTSQIAFATAAIAALSPLISAATQPIRHVCLGRPSQPKSPYPAPKHGRQVDSKQHEAASPGWTNTRAITSSLWCTQGQERHGIRACHLLWPMPACGVRSTARTWTRVTKHRFSLPERVRVLRQPGVNTTLCLNGGRRCWHCGGGGETDGIGRATLAMDICRRTWKISRRHHRQNGLRMDARPSSPSAKPLRIRPIW